MHRKTLSFNFQNKKSISSVSFFKFLFFNISCRFRRSISLTMKTLKAVQTSLHFLSIYIYTCLGVCLFESNKRLNGCTYRSGPIFFLWDLT